MNIRASEMYATELCPGRAAAQEGLAEAVSTDSEFGTVVHAADAGDKEALSKVYQNPAMRQSLESIREKRANLTEHFSKGGALVNLLTEASFKNGPISGHPDWVSIWEIGDTVRALIFDSKTGWKEQPEPAVNLQIRTYVFLLFAENPEIDEIVGGLIPSRFKVPVPVLYTRTEHYAPIAEHLLSIVAAASAPDAPRVPSQDACRYCLALGTPRCPETQKLVSFAGRELLMNTLTPEKKAEWLDVCRVAILGAKKFMEACRAELEADPAAIPGYELTPGVKRRAIVDVSDAYRIIMDKVDIDEFTGFCKISMKDYEGFFARATGLKGKALKDEMAARLGESMKVTETRQKLTRIGQDAIEIGDEE